MNVRPATDIAEVGRLFAAARDAGTFGEWGGVRDQGEQDAREDIAQDGRELWMVHDDAGAARGWLRCVQAGQRADAAGTPRLVWRYALYVLDPTLPPMTFARLYLGACKRVALAHPEAIMEGSVVAGGALDRLWQRYIADWRELRDEPRAGGGTLRAAYYHGPAAEFAARLP
ncbi:MAG: hypothetical protein KGI06_06080 [Candidatus Micrarchaeota archaeon]|nr:hypothetical protein [Candidatus Micrarchaeota archaeon]